MFHGQVFHIFKLAERLSMSVVGHTAECSVGNWFEVSVTSEGSIVLVDFFIPMALSPSFVIIRKFRHNVLDSVAVYHFINYTNTLY